MSIATDITRINTAKSNIKTSLEGIGLTVPSETKIDGYAGILNSMPVYNDEYIELKDCLCFTANTAGSTVAMVVTGTPTSIPNFQYSYDGVDWSEFIVGTTTITLVNISDKVYFKGNNPDGVNKNSYPFYRFVTTGSIMASGNIMSLIDNGACNTLVMPCSHCFFGLFTSCTSLITPPELPATTLTYYCYAYMFYGCTSLQVNDSPVTGVAEQAWTIPTTGIFTNTYAQSGMFTGCLGTRSSDAMAGEAGQSYTYYTQNEPV